jgi:S-adenosylmethionine decarboxylase
MKIANMTCDIGTSGSAYTVGPMNRDHWLLYLTSPNTQPLLPTDTVPLSPTIKSIQSSPSQPPQSLSTTYKDHTLEILMSHLDSSSREPFFYPQSGTTSGHDLGRQTTQQIGIDQLFPSSETVIDSFGFEPCGYSANAVIGTGQPENVYTKGKPGGGYFTIHVTPEEGWSYASFECNVPLPLDRPSTGSRPDLSTLIKKVVSIFKPNRLSITLFVSTPQGSTTPALATNGSGTGVDETEQKAWEAFGSDLLGEEFARKDRIGYEFDGYDLVFACFEKKGWVEPKKVKALGAGGL